MLIHVDLINSPDAVAKMMLTVKQGGLSIETMSFNSVDDGRKLSGTLTLIGPEEKGEWLAKKLLNFPYFHAAKMLKLE
jgi:hypothetical protein